MIDPVLIAAGFTADIYAIDEGRVLRRYRDGGDTSGEAALMRHLHDLGYPVPRVHEAAGPDLVLDRLHGPTLADAVISGGTELRSAARVLVGLLRRLHALPARHGTDPDRILHLDLHLFNVMLTQGGPMVIDWCNASEGPPGLDLAMTAVIIAETATDPASEHAELARDLLAAYLVEAGPLVCLSGAVELRSAQGPLGPARMAEVEGLIRAMVAG
ncbi:phosphotransferase [Micromonospora sp. GCM10011542]|uniref:phosphotransferase n=1 Tax=Micromonospora sp. GCM10011542 TaxID=3317337 RepID=UPI00360E4456